MDRATRITGSKMARGTATSSDALALGRRALYQLGDGERDVLAVDRAINARGFQLDITLARSLAELSSWFSAEAQAKAGVDADVVLDPRRLQAALADAGVHLRDVQRATLEDALEDPDLSSSVRGILLARTEAATNTERKLGAALRATGTDGRVRDTLVYAAAHTGRWSGRGFQPQNLPRGLDTDVRPLIAAALASNHKLLKVEAKRLGLPGVAALLRGLVRSVVVPARGHVLVKGDFAQVEPRILAWLARDEDKLTRFAAPGSDLYRTLAARLLAVPETAVTPDQRRLGKVGELGCGYGMGAVRAEQYGAAMGVDWLSAPVSADAVVRGWRDANPLVTGERGLWRTYEQLFELAATGECHEIGCVSFEDDGKDVLIQLPSSRRLRYRDVRVEVDAHGHTQISYEQRGRRVRTWGAKLVENVVQAIGRDLLAEALVRLEENGFATVLHVHDEVVVETRDEGDRDVIERILVTLPEWARGLPLAAKVTAGNRYA